MPEPYDGPTIKAGDLTRMRSIRDVRALNRQGTKIKIAEATLSFKAPKGKVFVFLFLGAVNEELIDKEYHTAVQSLIEGLGLDIELQKDEPEGGAR